MTDPSALTARIAAKKAEPAFQAFAKALEGPVNLEAVWPVFLREAAAVCDEAASVYAARGAEDADSGANTAAGALFALMETFLRKASEAEYVVTPCDPMVPCEDGGEPCHVHERLMAHAEGDHDLCEPNCGTAVPVSSPPPAQPTADATHGLSVQHADALWDAVAIPGPTAPTFPMQHERVCRAVAEILDEVAPAAPTVPVSSPPPDQAALRQTVVAAIKASPFQELRTVDHAPNGPLQITIKVDDLADILTRRLVAVLPPPADGAAVLREAADRLWALANRTTERGAGVMWAADWLRRLAAEAQPGCPACGHLTCMGGRPCGVISTERGELPEPCGCTGAEAQQPHTEARTSWTPGPVALARAADWATKRQDATVDPAMCPRCKGDNSEAFQLCAACAGTSNADPIVAYRSPGGHYLYCTQHTDELGDSWTPVTSDDLPDGGLCGKCGVDVLIPQEGNR